MRVTLTGELTTAGYEKNDIARLTRDGALRHLRRGAYGYAVSAASDGEPPAVVRHRELIRATVPQLDDRVYVSHQSAAVLHGLPIPLREPDRVTVTRSRRHSGRIGRHVHLRVAPVTEYEATERDSFAVTSLARTVIDIARAQSFDDGVVVADAALALGMTPPELLEASESARHRPGGRRAHHVANFADGRSENPGESRSRAVLRLIGIPTPDIQVDILDRDGTFVARPDFIWTQFRTLGEFDGRIKYGRALAAGQDVEEVLFDEKRREDHLRDLGWQVVRWIWDDLGHPERIVQRLQRAFARGRES